MDGLGQINQGLHLPSFIVSFCINIRNFPNILHSYILFSILFLIYSAAGASNIMAPSHFKGTSPLLKSVNM